jgi:hypothetical protein
MNSTTPGTFNAANLVVIISKKCIRYLNLPHKLETANDSPLQQGSLPGFLCFVKLQCKVMAKSDISTSSGNSRRDNGRLNPSLWKDKKIEIADSGFEWRISTECVAFSDQAEEHIGESPVWF